MKEYQITIWDESINEEADIIIEANTFTEALTTFPMNLIKDKDILLIKLLK